MPKEKDANSVELLGSPEKLINLLVKGAENREWVLEKITRSGPPHKQLQHTLVLNRLEVLVGLLKKKNGLIIKPVDGSEINIEDTTDVLPVQMPAASVEKFADERKILEKLTKGPEHEILYTAVLLQVIEGLISAERSVED